MIALFLAALPVFDAQLTPHWDNVPAQSFPEFTLRDQSGKAFSKAQLQGKVTVASFFFAHCVKMCATLRSSLTRVQSEFLSDQRVQLLSHSVASDSPEILSAYARTNHINSRRWKLLTGPESTMRQLQTDGYHLPAMRGETAQHSELFILLDGSQRIRGVYNGTVVRDVELLIEDIHTLTHGD